MSGNYKKKSAPASDEANVDTNSLPHDASDDFDELFTPSSIEAIEEFERTQTSKEVASQDRYEQETEFSSEELSAAEYAGELEVDLGLEHALESRTDDEMADMEAQPAEFSSSGMDYDSSSMDYESEADIDPSGWTDTQYDMDTSQAFDDSSSDEALQASVDYPASFEMPSNEDDFDTDIQAQAFSDSNVDNEVEPVVDAISSLEATPEEEVQSEDVQLSASASAESDGSARESPAANIDQPLAENLKLSVADKQEIKKHLKRVLTQRLLDSIDSQLDSLAFDPGNEIKPDMNPDNLKQTYSYNLTPIEYGYIYQQGKTKFPSSINASGKELNDDAVSKPYELTEELDLDCGFSAEETEEFNDIDEEELVEQLSQLPSFEPKVKKNYTPIFFSIFLVAILLIGVHGYYQSDQISNFVSNIENSINAFTDNVAKNVSSLRAQGS